VAETLPVQRSVPTVGGTTPPGAPRAHWPHLPVPLVAAAPAPRMVLPVQRTPATPSVPELITGLISPARRAEPRVTPVVARRSGGGSAGGNASGSTSGSAGGGGSGGRHDPPPPGSPYSSPSYSPSYSPPAGPTSAQGADDSVTSRFDARKLKDAQVDELTHRLIGPLTRMLRTELRLDRERIGRLRDPRR
jgi:hypothetical protein